MVVALNTIGSEKANGKTSTMEEVKWLIDYCATYTDEKVRYKSSDMRFKIHSDVSYLSVPKARSRSGGFFYMGNKNPDVDKSNGKILASAIIMKNVMAAA